MKCKGKGRKGNLLLNDGETPLTSVPMVSLGLLMMRLMIRMRPRGSMESNSGSGVSLETHIMGKAFFGPGFTQVSPSCVPAHCTLIVLSLHCMMSSFTFDSASGLKFGGLN